MDRGEQPPMVLDDEVHDGTPLAEGDLALVERLWRSGTSATAVSPSTTNDLSLLQRFLAADDRTVVAPLLRRHLVATWRLAAVVTMDLDRAAEAVADAWHEVVDGGLEPIDVRDNPRAWLFAIVRRHALTHAAAPGSDEGLGTDAARLAFDETGDIGVLAASFTVLDEAARTAVWLHTVEGFDDVDIAHVLDLDRLESHDLVDGAMADLRVGALRGQISASEDRCRDAVARFAGYLDEDLAADDEAELVVHLSRCRRCSARLDALEVPGLSLVDRVLDPPKSLVDELRRTVIPASVN